MSDIDVYWSFRSPYSYLATKRLIDIASTYGVALRFRFVRPLALREKNFFKNARPQFLPYLIRDAVREGERLGLPVVPPRPDPVDMNLADGNVNKDQPLLDGLMDIGIAAEFLEGKGAALALNVGNLIWQGTENWHEGEYLAEACSAAGLSLSDLRSWAAQNASNIEEILVANEKAQLEHHWGVPLMVFEGEPFFGQDRLDTLIWRLSQKASQ